MKTRSLFTFLSVLHLLGACSGDPDTGQRLNEEHPPSEQQIESFKPTDAVLTPNPLKKEITFFPHKPYTSDYKKSPLATVSYLYDYNEETLEDILKTEKDVPLFKFATSFRPSLAPSLTITVSSLWAFPCSVKYKKNSHPWEIFMEDGDVGRFIPKTATIPFGHRKYFNPAQRPERAIR